MPAEPAELQRWDCYIDGIDDEHVHLVMADVTAAGDGRELGEFPRHLLAHLEPREGQYVTVRIMSDETLVIENTAFSDEDRARGAQERDRLLELLAMLRDQAEDRT